MSKDLEFLVKLVKNASLLIDDEFEVKALLTTITSHIYFFPSMLIISNLRAKVHLGKWC